ncbi:hypothetical protein HZB60_03885 [candidate division KSB1 bacterium]|nr:hypothetical protein [candidate division KSB1 bacterium]
MKGEIIQQRTQQIHLQENSLGERQLKPVQSPHFAMATLKKEEVHLSNCDTFAGAQAQPPHFIDRVRNRDRRHSALGYLSPIESELKSRQPSTPQLTQHS